MTAEPAAGVSVLEAKIDQRVYALYGLTAEEIKIVAGVSKVFDRTPPGRLAAAPDTLRDLAQVSQRIGGIQVTRFERSETEFVSAGL